MSTTRPRQQTTQYARPTAADVTCIALADIEAGKLDVVYTDTGVGRKNRGRVAIQKAMGVKNALGVLVKTPTNEGLGVARRKRARSEGRTYQPDSIVTMTGLVNVELPLTTKTMDGAQTQLNTVQKLSSLVLTKPARQSTTVLLYDTHAIEETGTRNHAAEIVSVTGETNPTRILGSKFPGLVTPVKIERKENEQHHQHAQIASPNPFDVNMVVEKGFRIFVGDIVIAPVNGSGLVGNKGVGPLVVRSIYDYVPLASGGISATTTQWIPVGVAIADSKPEREGPSSTRRSREFIPIRVGGTVSLNDSWKCFFGTIVGATAAKPKTMAIKDIESGRRYRMSSMPTTNNDVDTYRVGVASAGRLAGFLAGQLLSIFIQPLSIHSKWGFQARIGRVALY